MTSASGPFDQDAMPSSPDEGPVADIYCPICFDYVQLHIAGDTAEEMVTDYALTHVSDGTPICRDSMPIMKRVK